MGKLTCGCLNVNVHAKVPQQKSSPSLAQLGVSQDTNEEFFRLEIAEGLLDLEGIVIVQECLIKRVRCQGWIINQCVNCEMYTHAVPDNQGASSRILLNTSLKTDGKIVERLKLSSDFSRLYHIVLQSRNDNHPTHSLGLQSGKFESLQSTLSKIQTSLNKFLIDEESAMEERIREYEENERTKFAELQSKARRDKNAMINLVLTAADGDVKVSNPSVLKQVVSPLTSSKPADASKPGSAFFNNKFTSNALPQIERTSLDNRPKVIKPKITQAAQRPHHFTNFNVKQEVNDNDFDPMFDLDGMTSAHSEPFPSDEDTEDTDDSGSLEDSDHFEPTGRTTNMYSSSVPMQMPDWKMSRQRCSIDEDDEDIFSSRRHGDVPIDDIAASMSALARSVHCDGTEIFGDRPRPRLNTLDLGQV